MQKILLLNTTSSCLQYYMIIVMKPFLVTCWDFNSPALKKMFVFTVSQHVNNLKPDAAK